MSRLSLHPLLRSDHLVAQFEKVKMDSASNPLLGPAIMNKEQNASCGYLIALLLDEEEDFKIRVEKLFQAGHLCASREDSLILAVRILEIVLKLCFKCGEESRLSCAGQIAHFLQLLSKDVGGKALAVQLISSLCLELPDFDLMFISIMLADEQSWLSAVSVSFVDIALQHFYFTNKNDENLNSVGIHFR